MMALSFSSSTLTTRKSFSENPIPKQFREQRSVTYVLKCLQSDAEEAKEEKMALKVGSPIIIVEAPLMLKTATSVPCLRHNAGAVKAGDVGRIISRKPKDTWAIRLAIGFDKKLIRVQVTTTRKQTIIGHGPVPEGNLRSFRKEFQISENCNIYGTNARYTDTFNIRQSKVITPIAAEQEQMKNDEENQSQHDNAEAYFNSKQEFVQHQTKTQTAITKVILMQ